MTFQSAQPGPRLLVLGGVHGDEPCGSVALAALAEALETGALALQRGTLTLVPCANPLAGERGTRAGDRNLNRSFVPMLARERVDAEDEVVAHLAPLIADHDVLLDLHSASAPTEPFAMIGLPIVDDLDGVVPGAPKPGTPFPGAALEAGLAGALGVGIVVEGWLDAYGPTTDPAARRRAVGTNEYARTRGVAALTVECGQHEDPRSAEVAREVALRALAQLRMTDAQFEPVRPRVLRTHTVILREHDEDRFAADWTSFERVRSGEVIGVRADGTAVVAVVDGAVMFPDADADVGEEWVYVATGSTRSVG